MVIKFSGKKISGQNILGWVKKKVVKKIGGKHFCRKKIWIERFWWQIHF